MHTRVGHFPTVLGGAEEHVFPFCDGLRTSHSVSVSTASMADIKS